MKTLTLALSGGGAAGLGHIPVLEALDDLEIVPEAIAGTSIGAIVGVCRASGLSGADLRAYVTRLSDDRLSVLRRYWQNADYSFDKSWLSLDPMAAALTALPEEVPETFEELEIPCTVVATDFYGRRAHEFRSGPIRPAIAASIAIPGVFRPMEIDGRVFVDGGVTDNLPVRSLPPSDICLVVDVVAEPPEPTGEMPGISVVVAGSMRIMMRSLMSEYLARREGVILIEPDSNQYAALDFEKAPEILAASEHARADTRAALEQALGQPA